MSIANHPLVGDWIECRSGRILVKSGKVDIGQRITTALALIVAEELDLEPHQIEMSEVRTGYSPDEGVTSGSNSIEQSGKALRHAAATIRQAVLERAVRELGVTASLLEFADGEIGYSGVNRRLRLLDLIADLPADLMIDLGAPVKQSDRQTRTVEPRGLADMVQGKFIFVHDLERPGMFHARVVRPPHNRARLSVIDQEVQDRLENAGINLVRDGSFLAVAGEHEWPVTRAAERLAKACEWDEQGGLLEGDVFLMLQSNPRISLPIVDGTPRQDDVPPELDDVDHAAIFERPYQMHGALAPSAAMAEWSGTHMRIHTHSQGIYPLRASIAESLDLPREQVELIHVPGSGCYGHNGADDAALDAALIALALPQRPILLKWSRSDEHGWEPYAPAMHVQLAARLDADGKVSAFAAEASSDTHSRRPRPGPNKAGPARLLANQVREQPIAPHPPSPQMGRHVGIHRNLDPIYDFPKRRIVKTLVHDLPLRTSAMRCLGAAANVFAIESFMEELATKLDLDPLEFRRRHLKDSRAVELLAAIEPFWSRGRENQAGRGRGLAYAQYKNAAARVATMVELHVDDAANTHLDHAVIAVDAGRIVDAEGLKMQMEGGFIQAAGWALHEEVRWDRGGVLTRDWESYPTVGFDNVPEIDVILFDRPEEPSVGAGEASSGPALAAIANAIENATGLRLRRIPFTPDALRDAAIRQTT